MEQRGGGAGGEGKGGRQGTREERGKVAEEEVGGHHRGGGMAEGRTARDGTEREVGDQGRNREERKGVRSGGRAMRRGAGEFFLALPNPLGRMPLRLWLCQPSGPAEPVPSKGRRLGRVATGGSLGLSPSYSPAMPQLPKAPGGGAGTSIAQPLRGRGRGGGGRSLGQRVTGGRMGLGVARPSRKPPGGAAEEVSCPSSSPSAPPLRLQPTAALKASEGIARDGGCRRQRGGGGKEEGARVRPLSLSLSMEAAPSPSIHTETELQGSLTPPVEQRAKV